MKKPTLEIAVSKDPERPRLHSPWGQVELWGQTWDMATDGYRLHAEVGTRYMGRIDAPPGAAVIPDPKRVEPVLQILNTDMDAIRSIPRKWVSWIVVDQSRCLFSAGTAKRDWGQLAVKDYVFRDVEVDWFVAEPKKQVCVDLWYLLDAIKHVNAPAITVTQSPGDKLGPYLVHPGGIGAEVWDRFAVVMPRRI